MVVFPDVTASASKMAISLWLNAVVPTLFPFMIMANFIKRTGIIDKVPVGIYPFTMAVLSGYPMGAKLAADAYLMGFLAKPDLYRVLSYSMVTGPAFIIGAVGVEFYDEKHLGYILAISHYLSAALNGLLHGGFVLKGQTSDKRNRTIDSNYTCLTDAILDSFKTIGIILAYIMMFMIGTDMLQFSGAFSTIPADYGEALIKGMMEMTVGCNALRGCQCSMLLKLTLTSFFISFGGLSIMGQSMSMLKDCPVTFWKILQIKSSHGVISGILTFTICAFVV